MKQRATDTIKFKKLKKELNLPFWQVVGLLESLWHITQKRAPDGIIGRLSNEDIALELEWSGDPGKLIQVLCATGWVDPLVDPAERLAIHDWADHRPCKSKRHAPDFEPTNTIPIQEIAQTESISLQSIPRSLFGLEEPERKLAALTGFDPLKEKVDELFEAYPRRINPGSVRKAYELAIFKLISERGYSDADAHAYLLHRVRQYANSPAGQPGTDDVRPSLATWLTNEKWAEPDSEWRKPNGSRVQNGSAKPTIAPLSKTPPRKRAL